MQGCINVYLRHYTTPTAVQLCKPCASESAGVDGHQDQTGYAVDNILTVAAL